MKLIDESYNASPASMLNCIDYFENFYLSNKCKKIIILGEMLELGKMSEKFHKQILTRISNTSIDIVIICGKIYKKIFDIEDSKLKEIYFFNNELQIIKFLAANVLKNDIILAKGSNASKINKAVKLLLKRKKVK